MKAPPCSRRSWVSNAQAMVLETVMFMALINFQNPFTSGF